MEAALWLLAVWMPATLWSTYKVTHRAWRGELRNDAKDISQPFLITAAIALGAYILVVSVK